MRVLIAGSSGFLGSHLLEALRSDGHQVIPLHRRAVPGQQGHLWSPGSPLDPSLLRDVDVVVNLAGSPLLGNPHSRSWARNLRQSRVQGTRTLAEAVAASEHRPAMLLGSGISFYGDHGADEVTESSPSAGESLLTGVVRDWEAAAAPALAAGARVCFLRTAPVLDRRSAPLKLQRLQYRLGLGGRIGSGAQFFPAISLRDWVDAARFLLASDDLSGPFNLCCPSTPTNAEFNSALAAQVHRPAVLRAPAPLVRLAAGKMAAEVLGSTNAVPQALVKAGYDFADPDITAILEQTLG